jgi:hypothetical protein
MIVAGNLGSAQIGVKISFMGRQPNKESATSRSAATFPRPRPCIRKGVITLRIPSMKWSRYSVTNA